MEGNAGQAGGRSFECSTWRLPLRRWLAMAWGCIGCLTSGDGDYGIKQQRFAVGGQTWAKIYVLVLPTLAGLRYVFTKRRPSAGV